MLSACFVCYPAAPVIDPAVTGGIGGTETRAWLFARMLARREDAQVTFVARHRQPLPAQVDGVDIVTYVDRVYRLFEQVGLAVVRRPAFPWLTIRRWTPSLLWQLPAAIAVKLLVRRAEPTTPARHLEQIPCDVFCTFGVQSVSATVIASAHAQKKPAVLVLGSDGDLDPQFLTDPDYVNPYGDRTPTCLFILREADAIVCQTEEQRRLLKERFDREGIVIQNPIDLERFDQLVQQEHASELKDTRPVLWVGRAEAVHKRPILAVEIARRCPGIPFVLVMNPRDAAEETRVRDAAGENVTFRDVVPPAEMPSLMASSLAMLNTSSLEGFPNTFLQAGAAHIPVVSLDVGEDFLQESRGGVYCQGDLGQAAAWIQKLSVDDPLRTELGQRGRQFVQRNHDAAERTAQLFQVLSSVQFRTA